uniref:chitobiase/beta-hexosaminidase C-terminal domain-containing protein n=1 Tax=Sporofaciens musculi TaxID=2681861 RepID=UPI0025A0B9FA
EKKFSIKPAVLLEENVTITPETTVYNGKKQEPTIQVLLEDGSEMDKDNYTVTASTDNFTDATGSEPIVFTIEGKGNFSGKITKSYTISEAPLTITKIKPKDRQYNGSKEVEIEEVQFTGLLGTDKPSDITLESKGLVESENVNESGYSTITFDEFKLGGEKGKNYVVQSPLPGEAIVLDKPVIISQADAPATPDIKCTYEVSATYPGKFVGTMSVANAADGAEYQYRWKAKDSEEFTEWQTDNVFDNIVPGETWIVEAQSVGNENIKQSEIGQAEITFEKLAESRVPEGITMEFALNKDGETYTATVLPELPELEYFIGKSDEVPGDDDYLSAESGRNPHMKTDCEAATEYTAYVRFKETATHKASEPTKVTGVTETLVVKEPTISLVRNESSDESDNKGDANNEDSNEEANAKESSADDITLNDNEYLETGKVKITCKTKGATIYYTTDGTDPTDQDNEYTGPFEISNKGETTIKAFAIKDGREDSPTASATFIRRLLNVETPIITPEDGESFTGSTLVTIECPTEGADIYYTTDGSDPDPTNKKQKYKEPFRINTSTTINAIGVMKDMDPSEMATSSLEKLESTVNVYSSLISFATTGEDAQNNPISDELMEKLGTKDKKVASESIVAQLTSELSVIGSNGDFTYDRMRFYDLVLKVKVDSEPLRDATADDFSEGGLTVTVPYPEGTSLEANDFAIAHMFGSGENTGKIETWQNITVTKTPSGLQFTVTSASPLAIAWTTAVPNGPNSNNVSGGDNVVDPDDPNGDGQGDNQGDGQGDNQGDGQGDNQGDVTVTANPRDGGTGDGTTTDNSNGTGTGTGAAADAVKSAAASLLPKTGDTSKLIVWVVLAVACVAIIVGIQIKSKKGNRKK